MAQSSMVLFVTALAGLMLAASAIRTPEAIDATNEFPAQKTWKDCHDSMASKIHSMRHDLHFQLSTEVKERSAPIQFDIRATQEGIACTWEEVFMGMELCVANWRQLNKTLTPANEVSRASTNLRAKSYICGLERSKDACEAVPHCHWNDEWGMCPISTFYFTLQFACHDSPVRKVSICIDYDEDACSADARCKWRAFGSPSDTDVCLPADTPEDWSAKQVYSWLFDLFNNEENYYTNWGDCATSRAWAEVTAYGKRATDDDCAEDANCIWIPVLHTCTLRPDKIDDVMWGGDHETLDAVFNREAYCRKLRTTDVCVRAMPSIASRRLL